MSTTLTVSTNYDSCFFVQQFVVTEPKQQMYEHSTALNVENYNTKPQRDIQCVMYSMWLFVSEI